MNEIIKKQIEVYRASFFKHGKTPQGTSQNNTATQYERFNQLLKPLFEYKLSDFSICDVGSGICDLHSFLNLKKIKHQYTGVEIVPEMVEASKELYPKIRVLNTDLINDALNERFDFVVSSGTFYIPGKVENHKWEQFIFAMIKRMFDLCEIGISFNALTTYSTFRAEDLFYLDPMKTLDFIQNNLSRFCVVSTSSPLYEVTYSVFKGKKLQEKYPNKDFEKYFKNI